MSIDEELNYLSNRYNDAVMELIYLIDEKCTDKEKILSLMGVKEKYEIELKDFKLKHNMNYGVSW